MMKQFTRVSLALSIRLFYMLFCLLCIYRVRLYSDNKYYWLMMASIGCLLVEAAAIVWIRLGKEFNGLLPSVFLFMCCVIPAIWVLCLDEAEKRSNFKQLAKDQEETIKQMFTTFNIVANESISHNDSEARAFECCDINLSYWIREDYFESNLLFQLFLIIITLGRFLATLNISLNQRLAILFTSLMVSIDMIQFLSFINIETVFENIYIVYLILFITSFSLTQFMFLNVETTEPNKFIKCSCDTSLMRKKYNMIRNKLKTKPFHVSFVSFKQQQSFETVMNHKADCCFGCGPGNKLMQRKQAKHKSDKSQDLFFIILSHLILHDISYLVFRVFMCSKFGWHKMIVVNDSNILFFMLKNLIVIIVQIYNLYSIKEMKKLLKAKDLLVLNRLESANHNKAKHLSNDPYRFAQVYDNADETLIAQLKKERAPASRVNLKANSNQKLNYIEVNRKNFEYQQQQQANRVFNPINEYQRNEFNKSLYGMSYLNFDKSENETNISVLDS